LEDMLNATRECFGALGQRGCDSRCTGGGRCCTTVGPCWIDPFADLR
jgi:hypothetical protein